VTFPEAGTVFETSEVNVTARDASVWDDASMAGIVVAEISASVNSRLDFASKLKSAETIAPSCRV
jgi:hypothetical protein